MDQNRAIQDFLSNLSTKFSTLDKRLTGLESFEYTSTNYFGTMGVKSTETQNIALPGAGYVRVRGMYPGELKDFTFNDSSLVCEKAGLYLVHYSLGVTLAATLVVSAYVVGDTDTALYSVSTMEGVSGSRDWMAKTVLMSLDIADVIDLEIKSSVFPATIQVDNASVTLHRIADK